MQRCDSLTHDAKGDWAVPAEPDAEVLMAVWMVNDSGWESELMGGLEEAPYARRNLLRLQADRRQDERDLGRAQRIDRAKPSR